MPVKINIKSTFLYIIYAAACLFLNGAVSGVPLSLGLCFSLLICGGNLFAAPLIYIACSAIHLSLISFLCSLFEASFLLAVTCLYRRTHKKIHFEAAIYFIIALSPFIIFSNWNVSYALPKIGNNAYLMRGIASAVALLCFLFSYKSVYACMFRLGRCRLKEDEYVCLAALYVAAGIGAINFAGVFVYIALSALFISLCVRFYRGPSAVLCAIALSLPYVAVEISATPLTAYIVITAVCLMFARAGRAAPCAAACALTLLYSWYEGFFSYGPTLTAIRIALIALCCAIACIPSADKLKKIRDRMEVKKVLPDTAVGRERERTGEKLFRISEVFREIDGAFKSMDEGADEGGAKKRVLTELKERCCTNCERRQKCEASQIYSAFSNLIETGTVKGKVSVIDLPTAITQNCARPADIIGQLNALLAEYRRHMTEAENARAGRFLLADQAKGISFILKNCAIELCKRKSYGEQTERTVISTLAQAGISCPEIYINGEENTEVCLTVVGKANTDVIARTLEKILRQPFTLKDKLVYDGDKCCFVFCRPPRYDAVFGVAVAKKSGETASGDTHSVMRINEHRFLMALSDGMGSGEYARRISSTAISLIEAFYRAEMPQDTVLETINKLLTFSRDERFACIDICAVNLNTGEADFVKIGSPIALVIRQNEIKVLESQSLPLGILDCLKPTVAKETLEDGDILVFMSDGITSAFSSTPELIEFLQPLRPLNPQNLADKILEGAKERTGGKAEDDMTVLCTRIFSNAAEIKDKATA